MKELVFLGNGAMVAESALWASQNGWQVTVLANAAQNKKTGISAGNISVHSAETADELAAFSKNFDASKALILSIGAPWILKDETLQSLFANRVLNLHGTRLPKDRGGNLYSWIILMGQKTGMCLLHRMTGKIDQGPVVACEEFIYPANCRLPKDYIAHYEEQNFFFLKNFIANYNSETGYTETAQPEYLSTYWPRLMANVNGWIDWTWDYTELERFICAFDEPYGGSRCSYKDKTVVIKNTWAQSTDGHTHPFQSGLVYRNNGRWLSVAAKGGELLICDIKDEEGNDLMPKIQPGDRLYTHPDDLVQAKNRVIKTAAGLAVQQYSK